MYDAVCRGRAAHTVTSPFRSFRGSKTHVEPRFLCQHLTTPPSTDQAHHGRLVEDEHVIKRTPVEQSAKSQTTRFTSHLLRTEQMLLSDGMSRRQAAAVYTVAKSMFDSTCSGELQSKHEADDWRNTITLFSEHESLRHTVVCRKSQSRDNATKAEISSRHPELRLALRERYLKTGQRLVSFRERTALTLPPDCGLFMDW